MRKCTVLCSITILITIIIGMSCVDRAIAREGDLEVPIDRIGENKKQKEKNKNVNLFQDSNYRDMKKDRELKESIDRQNIFQQKEKKINPKKELFQNSIKKYDEETFELKNKDKKHYKTIVIFLVMIGIIATGIILFRT